MDNTSIIVKNYHKKENEDSPQNTLIEFFSFCGSVQSFAINQEPNSSYTAIITFESPAAAQVSLLLNTAEIGKEGEKITVAILPESEKPDIVFLPISSLNTPPPRIEYRSSTDIISSLLQKGYKLKAGALDLAKKL
jgi:hypothetical protein